jgi:sensor histidine kinase YesM
MQRLYDERRKLPVRPPMERLNETTGRIPYESRAGSLHLRGTIVAVAASALMSVLTAVVCHGYLSATTAGSSFLPALIFGAVYWLWWGGVAIGMWWLAQRWPSLLTFSMRSVLSHALIATLLAFAHLALLEKAIYFSSRYWHDWIPTSYFNIVRFGFELLLYGFVLGFSGLLHVQSQSHRDAMRSLALEKQLSQAQLKALQMQMEPHFLFNTLNAVTTLVELGRNEEASETLAHLNTILRKTLQRSAPEKIPFAQELQVVESYLAIQQVRFADRLHVKIETTPDALEGLVPCFLLQPIIENAIRHGISNLECDGLLETSVERIGDKLRLRVRDNGPGLSASRNGSDKGHGIGIRNTRERLSFFYPDAHDFTVIAPDTGGYEVTIHIPYERQPA